MSRIRRLLTAREMISPKRTLKREGLGSYAGSVAWSIGVRRVGRLFSDVGIQSEQKPWYPDSLSGKDSLLGRYVHFSYSFFGVLSYCRAVSDCMQYSLTPSCTRPYHISSSYQ